ncbi:MAG: hypothetical protein HYU30_02610 [Chloroflexi bacterium]|nr:hypothetical protein [Chloroflexota bacterium]
MSKQYLVRARLEWKWQFEDETAGSRLQRPWHVPLKFGKFTLDQSPNLEHHLADLGFIEPDALQGRNPDWEYPLSLLYIECCLDVPDKQHPQRYADEVLEQLEALFRLFQSGDIYLRRHEFMWSLEKGNPRLSLSFGNHPPKAEPAPTYDRSSYKLDDVRIGQFLDFFDSYWSILTKKQSPLNTAVFRFSNSYERRTVADRLLELVIALDALFGDNEGDSATHKIALRGASWVYPPGEARAKAFDTIKEFYSDRSKLVHGRRMESKYPVERVQQLEDYVRQAITKFLGEAKNGKPIATGRQLDEVLFLGKN